MKARAVGIGQRRNPRGGDAVGGQRRRGAAGERRADDALEDGAVIGGAALMRVAIALDEARAFDDLQRQGAVESCGRPNRREPGFDLALLFPEAMAARPPRTEAGEKLEAEIAQDRGRLDLHAPICLLYTSDAADDLLCVDLGGRRIIK